MTTQGKPSRLLSLFQVLERLNVSRTTLHIMTRNGDFPRPVKMRGRVLWPETAVEDWIEARFAEVNSPPGSISKSS